MNENTTSTSRNRTRPTVRIRELLSPELARRVDARIKLERAQLALDRAVAEYAEAKRR